MPDTLYIDIETYSEIPLKTCGHYRYAEDVEILLFAYCLNDGPVHVWDCTVQANIPDDLFNYLWDDKTILCAHFSGFDRTILKRKFPDLISGHKWKDTTTRAQMHGLPGGLGMLSEIYKLPQDLAKSQEGKRLIQLFCKPLGKNRKIKRATKKTHKKEWKEFIEYARFDIEATRTLDKRLPSWNCNKFELELWELDQKINDRGFMVDLELAEAAVAAVKKEKKLKDKETQQLTDGEIHSANQRDALLKYILESHDVELPNMQESTLKRRMEDPELSEGVKELIRLRLASCGTSTTKYETLINAVNTDGRLRGTLQFCGASRTGRWSGRMFQPQNLPRPTHKNDEIEKGIEAIKDGHADLVYPSVKNIATSAIRGCLIAAPMYKLIISDLSSIEGRILAWLADEKWKIKAYKEYDQGNGFDMYVLTYSRTFGIKPEDVTKSQRQLGKTLELALGYGGGVSAFVTFANNYNIDLQAVADGVKGMIPNDIFQAALSWYNQCIKEKRTLGLTEDVFVACDSIKRLWRRANKKIIQLWNDLEQSCFKVLPYPEIKDTYKHFETDKKGTWLRIKLPSGRYLCYAGAQLVDGRIRYLGINQYTRKWCRLSTYGGKLAENITQAVARDVLARGMKLADDCGYKVILSVHDELITEVPDDEGYYSAKHLSALLSKNPSWSDGLPLAAEGFETRRYRKD